MPMYYAAKLLVKRFGVSDMLRHNAAKPCFAKVDYLVTIFLSRMGKDIGHKRQTLILAIPRIDMGIY